MPDPLPADALEENAQVLARMADGGDDLSKSREVDFSHLLPDADAASDFCRWAESEGYSWHIEESSGPLYDVTVSRTMVPDLKALTGVEHLLAVAAERFGGQADGWGCFAIPKLQS